MKYINKLILSATLVSSITFPSALKAEILSPQLRNLVERTSFGASYSDLKKAQQLGYNKYLKYQLNPKKISNKKIKKSAADKETSLKPVSADQKSWQANLDNWSIAQMAYSDRQLNELMTWFWDNHFNTNLKKTVRYTYSHDCRLNVREDNIIKIVPNVDRNNFDLIANAFDFDIMNSKSYNAVRVTMAVSPKIKSAGIAFRVRDDIKPEKLKYDGRYWLKAKGYIKKLNLIKDNQYHTYTIPMDGKRWRNELYQMGIRFNLNKKIKRSDKNRNNELVKVSSFKLVSNKKPTVDFIVKNLKSEYTENRFFRKQALGNFADLLEYSAKSQSMLIYLDNYASKKEDPNENYARELLELHTLGEDAGYTQKDVENTSKIFSGWTIRNNKFYFNPEQHNNESVKLSFINQAYDNQDVKTGERYLTDLAQHPRTAEYICQKLIELFVSDEQRSRNDRLVVACKNTFLDNKNSKRQLAKTIETILKSDEFKNSSNEKIQTPLEYAIDKTRKFNMKKQVKSIKNFANKNNYRLFKMPVPTGYKEEGKNWLSSSTQLIARIDFNRQLINNAENLAYYTQILEKETDGSAKDVLDFSIEYFIAAELPENTYKVLLETLEPDGFVIVGRQPQIKNMLKLLLDTPEAHLH